MLFVLLLLLLWLFLLLSRLLLLRGRHIEDRFKLTQVEYQQALELPSPCHRSRFTQFSLAGNEGLHGENGKESGNYYPVHSLGSEGMEKKMGTAGIMGVIKGLYRDFRA